MNKNEGSSSDPVVARLDGLLADLETLYKDVHSHPELSMQETRTAGIAADRLRAAGYEVTTGVGKTGVVGLLSNGDGPTVMLRADMDALPVQEGTGLPYASTVTATDRDGKTVPVGHMCGHDMHVTWLTGAAKLLADARSSWRGTLMAVFQPAEETAEGAQAMIDDGLFKRFPKPDVVLAARHARTCRHRRGPSRRHHVGGRQPSDSSVRTRRSRVDAAGEHRSRRHGGGDGDAASNDRVAGSGGRRGCGGHRRGTTGRHERKCHSR